MGMNAYHAYPRRNRIDNDNTSANTDRRAADDMPVGGFPEEYISKCMDDFNCTRIEAVKYLRLFYRMAKNK